MKKSGFEFLLQDLAKQIRAIRQEKGISQEALALAAEVDRSYVSQLERCVANPSLMILYRIALALDVDLKVLLAEPQALPELIKMTKRRNAG